MERKSSNSSKNKKHCNEKITHFTDDSFFSAHANGLSLQPQSNEKRNYGAKNDTSGGKRNGLCIGL